MMEVTVKLYEDGRDDVHVTNNDTTVLFVGTSSHEQTIAIVTDLIGNGDKAKILENTKNE